MHCKLAYTYCIKIKFHFSALKQGRKERLDNNMKLQNKHQYDKLQMQ